MAVVSRYAVRLYLYSQDKPFLEVCIIANNACEAIKNALNKLDSVESHAVSKVEVTSRSFILVD